MGGGYTEMQQKKTNKDNKGQNGELYRWKASDAVINMYWH